MTFAITDIGFVSEADNIEHQVTLIMHGGADWSVNPSQSLTIAQKLQDLGKTYELIIYAGDGHILSRNQEDRDRRAMVWFKRHMKPRS